MKLSKSQLRWAAAAAGLAMVASLPAGLATAQPKPSHLGPTIKLVVAQNYIQVPQFGKSVFLDPGVYVAALGSQLEFQVQRASYAKPLKIVEIIHLRGGGTTVRKLPSWLLDGWNGLKHFIELTVRDSHGKIVATRFLSFCPNTNPQRTGPNSPQSSPFPQQCASNPFERGMVFGLQRDWAADPIGGFGFFGGVNLKLRRGNYVVTVTVKHDWRRVLDVSKRDASAVVHVRVVKLSGGCPFCQPPDAQHVKGLPKLPTVPTMKSPPKADLPDLSPLPSWGISVLNFKRKNHPTVSYLNFGATVWIGGNARLDVEGFRYHGSRIMQAYQYFWHDGRVVGRARAGTMGFDNQKGHDHWHFQQFAQYRLLGSNKSLVFRSQKRGFCIAPTDPVDLLLPHAVWVPSFTGFTGACGSENALWVQESLPVGWGDTYFQFLGGQAFNITNLPNGTYYIEIIANPEHVLHETNTHNDVSFRRVIIGGKPGHRTVRVPAYHGIDREGGR
ncbi:MAG TPA: lysyl oxidase family protein [Streptosporangiaceae bacterium]|nr:lysyl oxidase family protein [Streptosporangiaceae bacterium]